MKNTILYTVMSMLLVSCASTYQEIGGVNLLATHDVPEKQNYKLLATGVGSTKKEIKHSTAQSMNEAVKAVLDRVPGGDHLTNVKLYIVNDIYLAVSGDVWGIDSTHTYVAKQSVIPVKLTSR